MFDIGWGEFFLIGVVALIVVGPKELPGLFRTVGQWTGKARGMAREFQRSLEQAANESGMNEVSQSLKSLEGVNLRSPTKTARNLATKAMTPSEPAPDPRPSRPRRLSRRRPPRRSRRPRRARAPRHEGRRPDRRLDRAADRASRRAADPADQLAGRLLRGDDRRLHGRRADLQLPRRAARRAPRRARAEARADLHRPAAGLHDPGADLDLRRLHPRLPDHRLPALAVRGARPLPAREEGVPAVPDRLAAPVPARLRLRLLRGDPARLRLLPELPAVRQRRRDDRTGRTSRSSFSAPSTSTWR